MHNLKHIKTSIRQQRKNLSSIQVQQNSEKVCIELLSVIEAHPFQKISLYLSVYNEIELNSLFKSLWQQNKQIFLPIIHPSIVGQMMFAPFGKQTAFKKNRFNILEPLYAYNDSRLILSSELDLIVTPLVAFNQSGQRVGMGGGYYDRAYSLTQTKNINVNWIGVGYDFQYAPDVICNSWDMYFHQVITSNQTYHYNDIIF